MCINDSETNMAEALMQNVTFDKPPVGQSAAHSRKCTQIDLAHMNMEFASQSFFHGIFGKELTR
jgi:hypothetical protein